MEMDCNVGPIYTQLKVNVERRTLAVLSLLQIWQGSYGKYFTLSTSFKCKLLYPVVFSQQHRGRPTSLQRAQPLSSYEVEHDLHLP